MAITNEERKIIDLEHERERRNLADEEREISDKAYAKKDYESAMKWAIILIASGIFIAVVNTVTDGILKKILEAVKP